MTAPTLYLLDAYALIYRAFFALNKNPRITSKGLNTSAIIGFVNTLYEVIKTRKPTHIGVAFDLGAPTQRAEVFADYKANREKMPDELRESIPYIIDIIKGFNIPIFSREGYEADDIIGTLAKKAEQQGFITFMMTPDKDFGQLVSDNIFIYKPAKFGEDPKVVGVAEICEKYGIKKPSQLIDILGLWGDAIDNIPGIPGIGEKTASKLIADYGSMEEIIRHADDLKGKISQNIKEYAQQGLLSKQLATIDTNAPIPFDPETLRIKNPDIDKLCSIFDELEFRNFKNRFLKDYQQLPTSQNTETLINTSPEQPSLFDDISPKPTHNTLNTLNTVIHDDETLQNICNSIAPNTTLAIALENNIGDGLFGEMKTLAFNNNNKSFTIELPANETSFIKRKNILQQLFNKCSVIAGFDLKKDFKTIQQLEINTQKLFDVMIAHYLIDPEQRHTFEFMASALLDINIEQLTLSEKVDIIAQLTPSLQKQLETTGSKKLFEEIEMPLIEVLATMEMNGVRLDRQNLAQISNEEMTELAEIEKQIYQHAGTHFNIASPKQLGEILFDKMQIKAPAKKTKTGNYPTGEEVLQKIFNTHPIIPLILDFRKLSKLKSTYVDALPALISPADGLIHTSYNQAVTATGRLSSTNPNLQNIPVRSDKGKEIRKAFVARDSQHILLAADYSQIELRIIAHLSSDTAMCDAFRHGIDIHADTAARVFHLSPNDVTKEMRRKAKAVNFGIIYGMSAFGLAERVGISRKEAADIIDKYFQEYSGIKKYIEQTILFAKEKGFVETMLGRRRYLRDINSPNATIRAFAERNAINAPIQGTSADMIKKAMIDIHNEMKRRKMKSKMILQVHDELVFDATIDEVETLKTICNDKMINALSLQIPVLVEINEGKNWLEAH